MNPTTVSAVPPNHADSTDYVAFVLVNSDGEIITVDPTHGEAMAAARPGDVLVSLNRNACGRIAFVAGLATSPGCGRR